MASPENYNQMLSKLGKLTFLTTFAFLIGLRFFELVPKIEINHALVPPIEDYERLIEWCLSFGAIPLAGASAAWLFSTIFEIHNKLSKLIFLRYIWDRMYIVKPMLQKAGISQELNHGRVKQIMNGLYYPEIKNIDQHYVHVFWRYALQFWVIFEHFLVVLITTIALWIINQTLPHTGLLIYLGIVFLLALSHWAFVVTKKSTDQANQIPDSKIVSFFNS